MALSDPEVTVEDGKGEIHTDIARISRARARRVVGDALGTSSDPSTDDWEEITLTGTPHFADVLPEKETEAGPSSRRTPTRTPGRSGCSRAASPTAPSTGTSSSSPPTRSPSSTPTPTLDPDADHEIHTQKANGQSAQDPSQNVRIPVDIDFGVWEEAEEPEIPADTAISAADVETSHGTHIVVTAEVPGARAGDLHPRR